MELIKITKKEGQQLVSARELYAFLEIGKDFTSWCKAMFEYGFEENKDYALTKSGEPNSQGFVNPNPKIDYALTIDCAKELSMIQRTDKGKQARQYFIECERKLNAPKTRLELARENLALIEEIEAKEQLLLEQQPKVDFYEAVGSSSDTVDIGEVAKLLNLGIGRNNLFKLLREKKILMGNNEPYQQYVKAKWFKLIEQPYIKNDGKVGIGLKTVVFNKGIEEIRKLAM